MEQVYPSPDAQSESLQMTADIVSAYVGRNALGAEELPALIASVYGTLRKIETALETGTSAAQEPAVPIAKSITKQHIICLEDGKKLKMLKRYIRTHYNLSPDEYRRKWGLPANYPMVAPAYSSRRSDLAKSSGLGRKAAK